MVNGGQEKFNTANNGTKNEVKKADNESGAELGIETKKIRFWLKLSKSLVTSRAFIALLSALLGVGGTELKHSFEKHNPLEERYMCKPNITIKAEQGKYVEICGCYVRVEDIIKADGKKDGKRDIVELTCKEKKEKNESNGDNEE
ncbi:MAG: hypothetical protein QXI89_01285 [Candidatus Anstonellales archaeon]